MSNGRHTPQLILLQDKIKVETDHAEGLGHRLTEFEFRPDHFHATMRATCTRCGLHVTIVLLSDNKLDVVTFHKFHRACVGSAAND